MTKTQKKSTLLIAAAIGAALAFGGGSLFSSLSLTTYSETSAGVQNDTFVGSPLNGTNTHATEPRPASAITLTPEPSNDSSLLSSTPPPTTLSASMGFEGKTIPECCCSFCEIEEANRATVYPLLQKVVETPFFSHFKIDLCSTCELWEDAPLCKMKDCGVCECEEPPQWSVDVPELPPTGPDPECEGIADDNVVTAVDASVLSGWNSGATAAMGGGASFWMEPDEDDNGGTAQVVDLLKNPEGYTGYTGPSAEKVWSAVHSQNCFQKPSSTEESFGNDDGDDQDDLYCSLSPEQRLYNRFISGLHSSISLHIAHSYCLEMDPHRVGECLMWGPNDALAYERVLDHPDRVENLYVAFSLLLRAVVKAEHAIAAAVPTEDPVLEESLQHWQESLLPELLALPQTLPPTFDESVLLRQHETPEDRQKTTTELQRRFTELQSIMQCVGCDRCKLWGTLQTLGIGTALRILFHDPNRSIHLTRQEAVALVNTLERLSSSLVFAQEFRTTRRREAESDLFDSGSGKDDDSCGN